MDRERILHLAADMQQMIGEQPTDFILAVGEALALIDTDAIKTAIPVYNERMFHLGRGLSPEYIRALGLMLDAARVLAEASATANTRWRELVADWPQRH